MTTLTISREEIQKLEITSNSELANQLGLDYVDTTVGMNGYPKKLNKAIISDSIEELKEVKDMLNTEGYDVEELLLKKKDGQDLWNRTSTSIDLTDFTQLSDNEWGIELNLNDKKETILKDIWTAIIGVEENELEDIDLTIEQANEKVNEFYEEVCTYKGTLVVVYNPEQDYAIERVMTSDDAGYSEDSRSSRLAIRVSNLSE